MIAHRHRTIGGTTGRGAAIVATDAAQRALSSWISCIAPAFGLALIAVVLLQPHEASARTRRFCSVGPFGHNEPCGRHLQPFCTSGAKCDSGYHEYYGRPFPMTIECPSIIRDVVLDGGCYETIPDCDECGGDGQLPCPEEFSQYCTPGCEQGTERGSDLRCHYRTRTFCSVVTKECGKHLEPFCDSGPRCNPGFHEYEGTDPVFEYHAVVCNVVEYGGCYDEVPSCDDCGGEGQYPCPEEFERFCERGCDPYFHLDPLSLEPQCTHDRSIGEGCGVNPCMDGLSCEACLSDGCDAPFVCFPDSSDGPIPSALCRLFYRPDRALLAQALGIAVTGGAGTGSTLGAIGGSYEVGSVYGPNGEYGCYATACEGSETNIGGGGFVSIGFYNTYDDVEGTALVFVEEAGVGVASFVTSQVFSSTINGLTLIGTTDAFGIGASVLPVSVGVYACDTILETIDLSVAIPTPTATAVASPTPTATAVATRTPTPAPMATSTPIRCVGECNGDGSVTVADLVTMVRIALGQLDVTACGEGDAAAGGKIGIDDLMAAVGNALGGCPDGIDNKCGGEPDERFWECECVGTSPTFPFCGNGGIGGDGGQVHDCLSEASAVGTFVCGTDSTVPHGWVCQPMDGLGPVLGDADQGDVCQ